VSLGARLPASETIGSDWDVVRKHPDFALLVWERNFFLCLVSYWIAIAVLKGHTMASESLLRLLLSNEVICLKLPISWMTSNLTAKSITLLFSRPPSLIDWGCASVYSLCMLRIAYYEQMGEVGCLYRLYSAGLKGRSRPARAERWGDIVCLLKSVYTLWLDGLTAHSLTRRDLGLPSPSVAAEALVNINGDGVVIPLRRLYDETTCAFGLGRIDGSELPEPRRWSLGSSSCDNGRSTPSRWPHGR
jgi:hypothetical protein